MKCVFVFAVAAAAASLGGCGMAASSQSYEVAMCPEPLRISDCKIERESPYCTFENTAQAALSGYPRAWGYNKDGVGLTNYAINELAGLQPGQKRREQLVLGGESRTVTKIVICSMDPESPVVKNRITPVGTAK